jgi:uncharacterized repeat protein (TIGR01451 family)
MNRYRLFQYMSLVLVVILLGTIVGKPFSVRASVPAGYAEYFIFGTEDQLFTIFQDIDNDPNLSNDPNSDGDGQNDSNQMHSVISIAIASNNVTVYYDHWENGLLSGTNGDEVYTGNTGDVLTFTSGDINIPRAAGNTCTSTRPGGSSTACYDGGDRIYVAGGAVTVARASWPEVTDTVFALAWEVYPVKPYFTRYTIPVGEDLYSTYRDFEQVFVVVQAAYDDTAIQIDNPGTPGIEVNTVLSRGASTQLYHFNTGTTIVATKPVQAHIIAGQYHAALYSESRSFTAVPSSMWDTAYYNPVPSLDGSHRTEIYIYNPTASALAIRYLDKSGTNTFNVPANSTRSFTSLSGHSLATNSALYLEAVDGITKFWALGSGGTTNSTGNTNADYDYGYSLIPISLLRDDYYISWAPGDNNTPPQNNGSPVFVTPVQDGTVVYVDYSPSDGIPNVIYTLNRTDAQKIFDPDNDNTGMHIWATGPLAVVWGETGSPEAGINNPYMDIGYTSLPLPEEWIDIVLNVSKSANPSTISGAAGQTSTFTLVTGTGDFTVDDVTVVDTLPANWAYVSGSTTITLPDGSLITGATADPQVNGQNLTWNDFSVADPPDPDPLDMGANQSLTISFQGITTGIPPIGNSTNRVVSTGTRGTQTFSARDSADIYITNLEINKTSSAGGNVNPGGAIDYTITVLNSGGTTQNNIVVTDPLPIGTTYSAGSSTVSYPRTYKDEFITQVYTRNDGNQNWSARWYDSDGGSGNTPTSGNVQVMADGTESYALRVGNNPAGAVTDGSIYRLVGNLSACTSASLYFEYRRETMESADHVYVEASSTGVGGSYTVVGDITNGNDSTYQPILPISLNNYRANLAIRFRSAYNEGGTNDQDRVYIDDVMVSCVGLAAVAAGTPPNLVTAANNYDLAPGLQLVVTFRVTVNNPALAGVGSIDNSAQVTSVEQSQPLKDSTSDLLPLSGIGNFVWLDQDGDGVQDAGEPGIEGLAVNLYKSDGSFVGRSVTDAGGAYSFSVPAGDYYLFFDQPSGYSFNSQDSGGNDNLDSDPNPFTGQTASFVTTSGVVDNSRDAGLLPLPGAVGDYVWLDENGDGVQDVGENGIPNVRVTLTGADRFGNPVNRTIYSDSNGRYLFTGVQAGSYTVAVDITTLPVGLAANPTYDYDGVGSSHIAAITVAPGQEMMLADFGYNWVSPTDSSNPSAGTTGAIGDRIWIDADGDGFQDAEEAGLSGAAVELLTAGPDGLFGTLDDVIATTTTTGSSGYYIFDGLAVGSYMVRVNGGNPPSGYSQTGDADQPGVACTTCDNRTTAPIILAPGDVFVNADFGYRLVSGAHRIGDLVYVDQNGSGTYDAGELGISGISVNLIRDLDGDGSWDAGEPILATDITDTAGQYSFPGLPDGNYIVWVNDSANVLSELTQTADPDVTYDNRSAVTLAGSDNLNQDFGYSPSGQSSGDGLIGDTIFLDTNNNGVPDIGEGLEGVYIRLFSLTGNALIASSTTNENGSYFFGNLPAGNYVVRVDTANLPQGVSNTVDPDGGSANLSMVTLPAGGINLSQDFGYQSSSNPNTISGTLWSDTDSNGTLDGSEAGRFAAVTVVLYNSNGNIFATTTTDAYGNYIFPNLPNGTYRVDVTDDNNLLNGYWHSSGGAPGADNNSQSDPYSVTVTGGQSNPTADFGYYFNPAIVGNYVWLDRNNNGMQDADEPGIKDVPVTLTIVYPNGATTSITTLTGAGGIYSFNNLLLDENYDGTGVGEPIFTISFATPTSTAPSPTGQGTVDTDSNGTSTVAIPVKGQTNNSYDSGFYTTLLDLGDLPSNYPTLFSPGPANVVFPDGPDSNTTPDTTGGRPAVWLGLTVDTEQNGQPTANATGDGADEDGLVLSPHGWTAGGTSTLTITLNSSESGVRVYFGMWIDWGNGAGDPPDGTFDVFYSGSGVTGSPVAVPVVITVPATYVAPNNVYMRMRAYSAPITQADYQGTLVNGEVEDYLRQFNPTVIELIRIKAATSTSDLKIPHWLFVISLVSGGIGLAILVKRRLA